MEATSILNGKRKMVFFSILSILAVVLRALGLIDESGVELILSISGGGFALGNAGEHIGRGLGNGGLNPTALASLIESIASQNGADVDGPRSAREMVDRARERGEEGFARTPALFVLLFASLAFLAVLSGCGVAAETVRFEADEAWIEGDYSFEGEARYIADGENVTDWRSEGTLDIGGAGDIVIETSRGELSFELVTAVLVEHEGDELVVWVCPSIVGFFEDCFEARVAGG